MDHPNVAKIHDGGSTETGRPYFVMELVRGVPITQYCDENRLTTTDRLKKTTSDSILAIGESLSLAYPAKMASDVVFSRGRRSAGRNVHCVMRSTTYVL
ncbi:MAG: hypothetical protein ACC645_16160 [Pirellulales bacterium]